MLPGKRLVPDGCPKQERLRRRVSSLFLNNTLSALDACELARDAEAAGAGNIRGLPTIGERQKDGVSQGRDVRTYLSKNSLYWFEAVVFDRKEQKNVRTMLPMLLPHEVFSVMREKRRTDEALCDRSHLQPGELQKHAAAATGLGVCPESVAGIGLWGDGVPMTRNRNQSLVLRLPIFVIHKHWLAKNDTWDEVMRILAWSLRHLASHRSAFFGSLAEAAGRASRVPGNSRGLGLLQAGPLHAGLAAWLQ